MRKIAFYEPWFFLFFGVFHLHRIWGLIDRKSYADFWITTLENRTGFYYGLMTLLFVLCILGIISFFKNIRHNYWWRWIYIAGGSYLLFDLFAICAGLEFWNELLLWMYDTDSSYWNLIWSIFIALGGFVSGLGLKLLREKMRENKRSIYRNEEAKNRVLALYDKQMEHLEIPYKDLYLDTYFGRTHLIECGNLTGKPLLVFHGGNATTAYNLQYCGFLLHDFHIFAVDTIGHPGKSAEVSLSPYNQDYGKWAADVIKGLGFDKMACFGGSFGAGIVVKAMCAAPEAIERSALLVPSAIKNAPAYKSIRMAFPMLMYLFTHKESWFVRCILPMALTESNLTEELLITARCSIENAKIKPVMPQNEKCRNLSKYCNPVLVMAAEKDCLFPAGKVLSRVEKVWKQSKRYLLKDRGHINQLTKEEEKMIVDFLAE